MGDPLDEATGVGAVINRAQYDKIADHVAVGETTCGVEATRCGRPPGSPDPVDGLFC